MKQFILFFIKHFLLFRKCFKTAIYFFIISFETIGEANT